jgi:hypothetical protein
MKGHWTLGTVVAVLAMTTGTAVLIARGQREATRAAASRTVARTTWGDPDLQGIWNYGIDVPLERTQEFGRRLMLTDEEVAKRGEAQLQRRREIDGGRTAPGPGGAGGNYNRFWTDVLRPSRQTSLVIDPPDGKIPPLTPHAEEWYAKQKEARKGIELDAPTPGGFVEDLGPRGAFTRCLLGFNSGPPMTPCCGQNENVEIFQNAAYVALHSEMIHSTRIVPLDKRPPLAQGVRQWLGISRGRWEQNTLIVTTTNFGDLVFEPGLRGAPRSSTRPNTGRFTLIERFTRTAADTLVYQFTIDDPGWYAAPWTAQLPMTKSEEPIFEYACHEGNYSLPAILRGARMKEAAGHAEPK